MKVTETKKAVTITLDLQGEQTTLYELLIATLDKKDLEENEIEFIKELLTGLEDATDGSVQ